MAAIPAGEAGNELWSMAAGQWLMDNAISGASAVKDERKIYDSLYVDITPSQQVLEAALDVVLAAVALEAEREAATLALANLKTYLSNQLENSNPDLMVICNYIKAEMNGNSILSTMMTNMGGLDNITLGWNAADINTFLIPPATGTGQAAITARRRYLRVVADIIAVRT